MSDDRAFPPIPEALLNELERRFPDRAPNISDTEREVWAKVGAQRVIRLMRSEFDQQGQRVIRKNP